MTILEALRDSQLLGQRLEHLGGVPSGRLQSLDVRGHARHVPRRAQLLAREWMACWSAADNRISALLATSLESS